MDVICEEYTVYDLCMQCSMQRNSCFTLLGTLTLVVRFIMCDLYFYHLRCFFYYVNILEIKAYTNETCIVLCVCVV